MYWQNSDEVEFVNDVNTDSWKVNVLPLLLHDYTSENVYNTDEFGLL